MAITHTITRPKTHLPHEYGMVVRTADDGNVRLTCRTDRVEHALRDLHEQAQRRWPADAYVVIEFWESYPVDERTPPTMRRSDFDVPKGPNPTFEKRTKPVDHTAEMFSADEMAKCQQSVRPSNLLSK